MVQGTEVVEDLAYYDAFLGALNDYVALMDEVKKEIAGIDGSFNAPRNAS
jgi:hypothetical protein